MPSSASGPNATCALKLPSVPNSSAFKIPSPFRSSGIVIAPIRSAGTVSIVSVAVSVAVLPAGSVAVTATVCGPSINAGKVLSASVQVPSPLLVAG